MWIYCVRILQPLVRLDSLSMLIAGVLSLVFVVFSFIPLFAASNDADDIKNVNWAYTTKGVSDGFYIGTYKFAVVDDETKAYSLDSDACQYLESLYDSHFCNECEHGQNFIIGFTVVFFIFSVFSAVGALYRALRSGPGLLSDIVLQHVVVVCSLISIIFGITAVAVFNTTCRRYWPFSIKDYNMGPAAALIILVVVFKFIEVAFHWLVTQEPLEHKSTLQDMDVGP